MTDNTNKPGDHRNDGAQQRSDKVGESLSKGSPEVNATNVRAAQQANPKRAHTVSPDGKPRFSITHDEQSEKQSRGAQEKAYRDAGLGDPHNLIGKSGESRTEAMQQHKPEAVQANVERAKEAAAKVFQSVYSSGLGAINETDKFLEGMGQGELDFVKETGQSIGVAGDYYAKALTGKVNIGADIKEFSGAIGKTLGVWRLLSKPGSEGASQSSK
jgi:hypothetical protein